jgi:hypothetical protein
MVVASAGTMSHFSDSGLEETIHCFNWEAEFGNSPTCVSSVLTVPSGDSPFWLTQARPHDDNVLQLEGQA